MEHLEPRDMLATVSVYNSTGNFTESSSSAYDFVLYRDDNSGELTVNYSLGGTATSGTDYTHPGGSVTFTDGNSWVNIPISGHIGGQPSRGGRLGGMC